MKNTLKSLMLILFVSLSFSAVAQSEQYGVTCEKGFKMVSQEKLVELYKEVFKLENAKFEEIRIDKTLDAETGEGIVFLKTQARLGNGSVLNISNRVYPTAEGTFSLNAPKSDNIRMTSCKSADPASECIPKLSSNGSTCEGDNCEKTSAATELGSLCK